MLCLILKITRMKRSCLDLNSKESKGEEERGSLSGFYCGTSEEKQWAFKTQP